MKTKTLIVVNVQGYFVKTNCERDMKVVARIEDLVKSNKFDNVIFTKFCNKPNNSLVKSTGWYFSNNGETILLDTSDKQVIETKSYNAFTRELEKEIKRTNDGKLPDELYICGFNIDDCILATSFSLLNHDVRPIIVKDCCYSGRGSRAHEKALEQMYNLFGYRSLVETKELKLLDSF